MRTISFSLWGGRGSDERVRAIKFSFSQGAIEMTASSADAGEAREIVPVDYNGAALAIGFNPQYLIDFLGACGTETVSISVKDSETQGMLCPGGAADLEYRYVVMPMKF